jgi:hypothetical protein
MVACSDTEVPSLLAYKASLGWGSLPSVFKDIEWNTRMAFGGVLVYFWEF